MSLPVQALESCLDHHPPPSISSISDKRLRLCNDAHVDSENPTSLQSQLFDNDGRLSVALMIRERQALQAQTSIHSERTFEVIMEPNYRDRKSTRLNSSHANISYAVFCLKKKTITPTKASPDALHPSGHD